MKKSLKIIFTICLLQPIHLLLKAQSGKALENIFRHEQESRKKRSNSVLMATPANGKNIDVVQYRMHLWLNPESDSIRGRIAIVFRPASAPVSQTTLDLASNMMVESVHFRNVPVQFSFSGTSTLNLNFGNQQLNPGNLDSLVIRYRGKPVPSAFGSYTRTQHNGTWLVYTLSEPYGAKDWWPCKQALSDKADSVDITLYTPAAYTAVGNGLLKSQSLNNGIRSFRWKHSYPIATYLIAVAATNYAFFRHHAVLTNGDTIPVDNYCYPENLTQWQNEMSAVTGMIQHFDTLLAPYPFAREKYGHTQFAFGGGMEHQTNSFMQNTDFGLQAHEVVHQWFGNKITCHSWEDIWLNEGFATYLAAYEYVRAGYSNWATEGRQWIDFISSEPGGSVFCSDTSDLYRIFSGRLSYAKGAMVLKMLRWKLGEQAFWQGIRQYIGNSPLAYSFARTSDLKSILEIVSGQNLTEFFNDWYKGQGFPTVSVTVVNYSDSVRVTFSQQPSHSSVSFFEMDVPVLLRNGSEDSLFRLPFTQNGQSYVLKSGFQIDSIKIDPERQWLARWNISQLTGIGNKSIHPEIHLHPNPFESELYFSGGQLPQSGDLLDVCGRSMMPLRFIQNQLKMDSDFISPGTYFIRLNFTEGPRLFRVIKK